MDDLVSIQTGGLLAASASTQLPRAVQIFAMAVAFSEACLFGVLAPLLPALAREVHLSDAAAGRLSAGYPIGIFLATVPAGLAASRRPRGTAVCGLWLVALASVGFAVGRTGAILTVARLLQGAGAAAAWGGTLAWIMRVGDPDGRGKVLATTLGAASAGIMVAPVLAALANAGLRTEVFLVMAVLLGAVSMWGGPPGPSTSVESEAASGQARNSASNARASWRVVLDSRHEARGHSLMLLIGIALGVCSSLGALLLAGDGVGNSALVIVFLCAYAPPALLARQIGWVIDRYGARVPMLGCLVVLAAGLPFVPFTSSPTLASVLLGALVSTATIALTPAYALVSEGAERHGSNQGMAMAVVNGAWGVGAAIGAAGSAAVAHALTPSAAVLPVAGGCLIAAGLLARAMRQRHLRSLWPPSSHIDDSKD